MQERNIKGYKKRLVDRLVRGNRLKGVVGDKYRDLMKIFFIGIKNPFILDEYSIWYLINFINSSNKNINIFLEIGVFWGGSFFVWSEFFSDAKKIGIDKKKTTEFSEGIIKNNVANVFFVEGDSKDKDTFNSVKHIIYGNKIDFLFIDGEHSYEQTKSDFNMYYELVSDGGVIAFHSIYKKGTGVYKFWNEIKTGYYYKEFCPKMDKSGIGAIIK